ncbi:MAG: hypothetical protein IIC04_12350 [Proteobacteria bacterium]|nr:hypothetical protein [Pseudomonadota bacterium]
MTPRQKLVKNALAFFRTKEEFAELPETVKILVLAGSGARYAEFKEKVIHIIGHAA